MLDAELAQSLDILQPLHFFLFRRLHAVFVLIRLAAVEAVEQTYFIALPALARLAVEHFLDPFRVIGVDKHPRHDLFKHGSLLSVPFVCQRVAVLRQLMQSSQLRAHGLAALRA